MHSSKYCGPEWLRRLLPDDALTIFHRATSVRMTADATEDEAHEIAAALNRMPYVRLATLENGSYLSLIDGSASVDTLVRDWKRGRSPLISERRGYVTRALEQVEEITLVPDDLTDQARQALEYGDTARCLATIAHLKRLCFRNCPINDASLVALDACRELQSIDLSGSRITDEGLAALRKMGHLTQLYLRDTQITDAAVDGLLECPSLEKLDLSGCPGLTEVGVLRVLQLPHLTDLEMPDYIPQNDIRDQIRSDLRRRYERLNQP
jgi:hypothetical protein